MVEQLSDESKAVASEAELLRQFSDVWLKECHLAGPVGNVHFPLRSQQILTVDSKACRQVFNLGTHLPRGGA